MFTAAQPQASRAGPPRAVNGARLICGPAIGIRTPSVSCRRCSPNALSQGILAAQSRPRSSDKTTGLARQLAARSRSRRSCARRQRRVPEHGTKLVQPSAGTRQVPAVHPAGAVGELGLPSMAHRRAALARWGSYPERYPDAERTNKAHEIRIFRARKRLCDRCSRSCPRRSFSIPRQSPDSREPR
jgi:hypothetical protein